MTKYPNLETKKVNSTPRRFKMPSLNKFSREGSKRLTVLSLIIYALCLTIPLTAFSRQSANFSFDGLQAVESAQVARVFINPEADFSVYTRVMILDPIVAFRSNWQREQNRRRGRNINARDMQRIKADAASFFKQILTQRLQFDNGYEVVDEVDYDVLLLRPAIIDLDITSPDVAASGRRSNTASAGQATLYIELFDSVSGAIIGRAIDPQIAHSAGGSDSWTNRTLNRSEGRRIFTLWADQLRIFLDQHYTKD
jgi:hypothetical protein